VEEAGSAMKKKNKERQTKKKGKQSLKKKKQKTILLPIFIVNFATSWGFSFPMREKKGFLFLFNLCTNLFHFNFPCFILSPPQGKWKANFRPLLSGKTHRFSLFANRKMFYLSLRGKCFYRFFDSVD